MITQVLRAVRPLAYLSALFVLAMPMAAAAQGVITGHVLEAETSQPLAGVSVRAIDVSGVPRMAAITDSTGAFRMALAAGTYALQAELIGYTNAFTQTFDVNRDETVDVALRMGVQALAIEPLVVRARVRAPVSYEVFEARKQRWSAVGQGRFITRQDIASGSYGNLNDLLRRDPALRMARDPIYGEVIAMHSRGNVCLPTVYLNGVRALVPDISNFLSPEDLEGVEIYPNASHLPGELAVGGSCGVVAFWTRHSGRPISARQIGVAAAFVALVVMLVGR